MTNTLTPAEEVAFPFLEAAVRIDSAKQAPDDRDQLLAVLENNAMMWTYFRNLLQSQYEQVPEETKKFLVQVSEFMVKAAIKVQTNSDPQLLDKLVALNLNMSEKILSESK